MVTLKLIGVPLLLVFFFFFLHVQLTFVHLSLYLFFLLKIGIVRKSLVATIWFWEFLRT